MIRLDWEPPKGPIYFPEEEEQWVVKHASHDQSSHGNWARNLTTEDWKGRRGERTHMTRKQTGTIPTSAIARLYGVKGEGPGEHRNHQGDDWEDFKADISERGIVNPIFITVDYGQEPMISEGNHRRDAAVELGLEEVPVEIRYFGQAEWPDVGSAAQRLVDHGMLAGWIDPEDDTLTMEDLRELGEAAAEQHGLDDPDNPNRQAEDLRDLYEILGIQKGLISPNFGSKRGRRKELVSRLKARRQYAQPVKGGKKKKRKRIGNRLVSPKSKSSILKKDSEG